MDTYFTQLQQMFLNTVTGESYSSDVNLAADSVGYIHNQFVESTVWDIIHNKHTYDYNVMFFQLNVDGTYTQVSPSVTEAINENIIRATFLTPIAGIASAILVQYSESISPALITPSITNSPTQSRTPSPTPTISVTPTITAAPSRTVTPTPSISITPTLTRTATPSVTPTLTPIAGSTVTPTPSITASVTPSITVSITPSVTGTPFATSTSTPTSTPTNTVTASITSTTTPTVTSTLTVTPTKSSTPTITPTITVTPTITPTITVTPTVTPTISVTPSMTIYSSTQVLTSNNFLTIYYGYLNGSSGVGASISPSTYSSYTIIGLFGDSSTLNLDLEGVSLPPNSAFTLIQFIDRNSILQTFYPADAIVTINPGGGHPTRKRWSWSGTQYFNGSLATYNIALI